MKSASHDLRSFLKAALTITALPFFSFSCAHEDDSGEDTDAFDAAKAELKQAVDDMVADCGLAGAVLGVRFRSGETWKTAGGYAHIENAIPMDPSLPAKIGSCSKTFTATVVLQLVDEGKISLDDDYTAHVPPQYAAAVPESAEGNVITLRNLLDHTSGIPDYVHNPDFQAAYTADMDATWDPLALLAYSKEALEFEPGAAWHYSNSNYILLGAIVESATGKDLAFEIQTRLLDELELSSTAFPADTASIDANLSDGYVDLDGDGELEADETVTAASPSAAWAAGAMTSTADDLLTWVEALVEGRFLSEDLQAERLVGLATGIDGVSYGLGIAQTDSVAWGHQGGIAGFSSIINRHEAGFDVVVLINGESPVPACRESNVATQLYLDAVDIMTEDLN